MSALSSLIETIRAIVFYARANGLDEVAEVQDYFIEKDSRLTRAEVERLIARYELQEQKDNDNRPRPHHMARYTPHPCVTDI